MLFFDLKYFSTVHGFLEKAINARRHNYLGHYLEFYQHFFPFCWEFLSIPFMGSEKTIRNIKKCLKLKKKRVNINTVQFNLIQYIDFCTEIRARISTEKLFSRVTLSQKKFNQGLFLSNKNSILFSTVSQLKRCKLRFWQT